MKSTSGGVLKWCGSTWKSWSSTADYHSVEFGRSGTLCHEQVRPTIGIFDKYRKDFGIELSAVVHSNATAYRRGLGGKTRHVKVQYLWIQDAVENKEPEIAKSGLWKTLLTC